MLSIGDAGPTVSYFEPLNVLVRLISTVHQGYSDTVKPLARILWVPLVSLLNRALDPMRMIFEMSVPSIQTLPSSDPPLAADLADEASVLESGMATALRCVIKRRKYVQR